MILTRLVNCPSTSQIVRNLVDVRLLVGVGVPDSPVFAVNARILGRYATVVDARTAATTKYDFILAGGGTAGLLLADRLTENPLVSVLVIEFGPFDQGEQGVLVPGIYDVFQYFWPALLSTPQPGLDNQVFYVPTGAVVGGGSTVNAMFFLRCAKEEYDTWERQLGVSGWEWSDLLPYFKKSETFTPPPAAFATAHNIKSDDPSAHGFNGPIHGSYPNFEYPGIKNFREAALSLGISPAKDPNNGYTSGIYEMLKSLDPRTETRSYSKIGHYDRVIKFRPNYHIITETIVSKVLFSGKTATGVQYQSRASGANYTATASREVILAAGAVHSPQILQLSGIGPKALLQSLGISVLIDLPGVGANLQDHLVLTIKWNYTNNIHPNAQDMITNQTYIEEQYTLYNQSRPSTLSLTATTSNNIILLPLRNTTSPSTYARIIDLASSINASSLLASGTGLSVIAGYKAQRLALLSQYASYETSIGSLSWSTGPTTALYMIKPFSRGSIKIASTNPLTQPLIDFGALTDPTDIEVVLALVRKNRQIMSAPSLAVLGPTELAPTSANITSDEDLEAAIRASLQPTNAHQCCTTAMLGRELGGVIDTELRVYRVKGLSSVGAASFPMTPAGAPQASVYGLAEKVADIIKARHGLL